MMFKSFLAVALGAGPAFANTYGALNLYWGQLGLPTDRLASYCDSPGVTSVTLSFVNKSPRYGNDYPGTNFAGHCGGEQFYVNPVNGEETSLIMNCDAIKTDIRYCQSIGKKVLLSIGGCCADGEPFYDVLDEEEGEAFAEQLHSIFGPYDPTYPGPRPFDISKTEHVAVDGFDFDIEFKYPNQAPYIRMVEVLRGLNPAYYITAAPQCPTSDEYFQLKELVYAAQFDALFIQFYNNPGCQASDDINFDDWLRVLSETDQSKDADIFIGLLASPAAGGSGYVDSEQVKEIVCALKDKSQFGGLSFWDATRGAQNVIDGKNFNEHAADALEFGCDSAPPTGPTTTSSRLLSNSTTTASVELTMSTVYATSTRTITSCKPDVPCTKGDVVTETIPLYTTVCPVTETGDVTPTRPAITSAPVTSAPVWTTSTAYTTKTYTVTSCAPDVAYCPSGQVTTEVTWYTTVCPATGDVPQGPKTDAPQPPKPSGGPHVPQKGNEENSTPKESGEPIPPVKKPYTTIVIPPAGPGHNATGSHALPKPSHIVEAGAGKSGMTVSATEDNIRIRVLNHGQLHLFLRKYWWSRASAKNFSTHLPEALRPAPVITCVA
ncbi:Endochitinase A1 like protein [Verticillium longisporum]|nr:Endochitinase A1 like protein [Verticillium longisporum]